MDKFIFEDLNSFVDGRLAELVEEEQRFQNQVVGVNEMFNNVVTSKEKVSGFGSLFYKNFESSWKFFAIGYYNAK